MNIPVVVFLYNRPEHTKLMLESIFKNEGIQNTKFYFHIDGPKNQFDKLLVDQTQSTLISTIKHFAIKNYEFEFKKINKGLACSVIDYTTKLFSSHESLIVMEDDLISSKYFYKYMCNAEKKYRSNQKIWSISGYSPILKYTQLIQKDVYFVGRGSSWGWLTWADRWNSVDWSLDKYHLVEKNYFKRLRFNSNGFDLFDMLESYKKSQIDSWAIRWVYSQFLGSMYTVYPKYSYINNIGFDSTGTNCGIESKYMTNISNALADCKYVDFYYDKKIKRSFRNFYLSFTKAILLKIKKILKVR